MCIRKSLFDDGLIRFDDKTFDGFHCYDIDICLQVRKAGFDVAVVSDVLAEHLSYGSQNKQWLMASEKLEKKWHDYLPQWEGIEMNNDWVTHATCLIDWIVDGNRAVLSLREELMNARQSAAYRLGRMLLKPLLQIKCLLK